MITLPVDPVPGSGVFVACLRATVWGIILAPVIAVAGLRHAVALGTMLLEGEGYILATVSAS